MFNMATGKSTKNNNKARGGEGVMLESLGREDFEIG
jgi:hypothetical protein